MPRKPNLLFILTDCQRADTLACYGNDLIQTPHLNSLAAESFVFENAYCTQPLCTPSRSSILTGLYPHTTGCVTNNRTPLRPETRTIAEMLSDDYLCAYYGKWHLGDEMIPQHGFEKWVSTEDLYRTWNSQETYFSQFSDYHHFLIANGFKPDLHMSTRAGKGSKFAPQDTAWIFDRTTAARLPEPFTKAAFLGREAAGFIRENRDRPFMLFVSIMEPHPPYTGPFDDLYDPATLPVGPRFLQKPPENASLVHRLMADHAVQTQYEGEDLRTEAGWRRILARYWGLVTLVDRAVGEILRALDASGVAEDTIVVFTSDHGDMKGDHGLLTISVLYEAAIKVPLLIRIPGADRAPQRIRGRVSQVDLAPTLLELLHAPVPADLQGRSLVPVLSGADTLDRNDVFIEWHGDANREFMKTMPGVPQNIEQIAAAPWRTIISHEGWKLNLCAVDQCEFYDLTTDPYEQRNLFDAPDQQGRIQELTGRIHLWQNRTQDKGWNPLPGLSRFV
ncbi:MAG: sulfatase-like hydrolase/transferase [Chloroflexi bacterium]|nr:sulfatase-like hydrolase/transferase [Chloroflexota bacterium]